MTEIEYFVRELELRLATDISTPKDRALRPCQLFD